MNEALLRIFGDNGTLKKISPHFISRPGQLQMAQAVDAAIQAKHSLVVEAGTGIGKTFAYLVPALLSHQKILISTGTKNLQDQLFSHDLPLLKKLISYSKKMVLLKGRINYLCLYRIEASPATLHLEGQKVLEEVAQLTRWAKITTTGDLAELENFSENAALFSEVTSTAESCLGSDCTFYEQCFVVKARKEALSADIVVINHHLFFADLVLKEESLGQLLPDVEVVIFDEAHQLYAAASSFLSKRFSSRQLLLLLKDVQLEYATLGNDHPDILRLLLAIPRELTQFRLALGESGQRDAWCVVSQKKEVQRCLNVLAEALWEWVACLSEQSQRTKGLENAWERACIAHAFIDDLRGKAAQATEESPYVFWFETFLTGFVLYKTPIDLAASLASAFGDTKKSWIYTSATLNAGAGMQTFTQPLGIQAHTALSLESPYDYLQQTRLYFPRYLPDVSAQNFSQCWIEALLPLLEAAQGRTFLLFTSHEAMQKAYHYLLKAPGFTLFLQGQAPKQCLVERFKASARAILLGTNSFWQGVDVQGAALCCVCIDKLPFASPGDPVTKARIDAYKNSQQDPFYAYQLPQAVILLKQGVGRLIRSEQDKGVLVLGDLRVLTKPYGQVFLEALPKMPIVRDSETVTTFLKKII